MCNRASSWAQAKTIKPVHSLKSKYVSPNLFNSVSFSPPPPPLRLLCPSLPNPQHSIMPIPTKSKEKIVLQWGFESLSFLISTFITLLSCNNLLNVCLTSLCLFSPTYNSPVHNHKKIPFLNWITQTITSI